MYKFTLLLFICLCKYSVCSKYVVRTNVGPIRGVRGADGDYIMFLGIPYAKINASNPFGASLPMTPFEKTYKASDDTVVCPQIDEFSKQNVGSIDCLRLNIHVPRDIKQKKLAVLVHFYGGYFRNGASGRRLYNTKYLVRHNIIVITFNYRVGPYGFLCLNTPEVPGNQGLKDQYDAVKWIKKNIAAFGGDENKITILGHSSGSQALEFHLLSQQPQMFNQAIFLSSSALYPHAFQSADPNLPLKIAENLGFKTNNTKTAMTFLTKAEVSSVIDATKSIEFFGICKEKQFTNVFRMVAEHPQFSNPNLNGVRIIAGFNNKEWLFGQYMDRFRKRYFSQNIFRDNLDAVFDFGKDLDKIEKIVRHFYIGDEIIGNNTVDKITDFLSDFDFLEPVQRSIKRFFDKGAIVYQYLFSYSGKRNWLKKWYSIQEDGATHADELAYLFSSDLDKDEPTTEDQVVIDIFTTLWANFVKYGNPTPTPTKLIPLKWSPITGDVQHYMDINYNVTIGTRPYHERMAFWELFYLMNEKHLRANKWR